jgi:hypothetical protein
MVDLMKKLHPTVISLLAISLLTSQVSAVVYLETGDPTHNTTTPGDNSGWQYEGKFGGYLGVPIAPHFFITAKHIEGSVGMSFDFHGDAYTTVAKHEISGTDLRIWEVNHAKPFPTYAPLSSGVADVGAIATIFGRGTQRGIEVSVSGEPKGWQSGPSDSVQRWGRNVVLSVRNSSSYGPLLYCEFDKPGIADECHLSVGDSGGGMFVLENGLWRLAGINLAVDGPFRYDSASGGFNATLFDAAGLEYLEDPNWISIPEQVANVPSGFYCCRISASLPAILAIAPEASTLSSENFAAWQRLYFSPAEITTPATTGPTEDADRDGICNLLEFALNLDPTFSERVEMTATTGICGLPLASLETVASADHLTLEFVRRTSTSGAAVTTVAEFSSDLSSWSTTGTETVTAINSRWERVKAVDPETTQTAGRRFARLKVE